MIKAALSQTIQAMMGTEEARGMKL